MELGTRLRLASYTGNLGKKSDYYLTVNIGYGMKDYGKVSFRIDFFFFFFFQKQRGLLWVVDVW
jgi:hypothetical protein